MNIYVNMIGNILFSDFVQEFGEIRQGGEDLGRVVVHAVGHDVESLAVHDEGVDAACDELHEGLLAVGAHGGLQEKGRVVLRDAEASLYGDALHELEVDVAGVGDVLVDGEEHGDGGQRREVGQLATLWRNEV